VFALSVLLATAPLHCSTRRQAFLHAKILVAAVCVKKKSQSTVCKETASTALTQLPALYSSPLDQQFGISTCLSAKGSISDWWTEPVFTSALFFSISVLFPA
jgi:hypothetical protein